MGALEHLDALLQSPTPIVRELAVISMGDMCIGLVDIKAIVLRESGPQLVTLLEVCYSFVLNSVCILCNIVISSSISIHVFVCVSHFTIDLVEAA